MICRNTAMELDSFTKQNKKFQVTNELVMNGGVMSIDFFPRKTAFHATAENGHAADHVTVEDFVQRNLSAANANYLVADLAKQRRQSLPETERSLRLPRFDWLKGVLFFSNVQNTVSGSTVACNMFGTEPAQAPADDYIKLSRVKCGNTFLKAK